MFAALPFAQQLFKTLSEALTGRDQVLQITAWIFQTHDIL